MTHWRPVLGAATISAVLSVVTAGGFAFVSVSATVPSAPAAEASSSPWMGTFTAVVVPAKVNQMKSATRHRHAVA